MKKNVYAKDFFPVILEMLAQDNRAIFTVTGTSMWPLICHGRDQVIVERCDPKKLKKGDIILFEPLPGQYMLHRITRLGLDYFETTGDGNCFRDGTFSRNCVKAKVTKIIRKGKKINCSTIGWKVVFWCWSHLFFVRKALLFLLLKLTKFKNHFHAIKR